MKLLDFFSLVFALAMALNVAVSGLYGVHFPFWKFAAYEHIYLTALVFCCVFQFARGVTRLTDG